MKALIIGANGRVGSRLAETLAEQGHQVFAAARNEKPWQGGITHQPFDLLADSKAMAEIIRSVQPDVVYFTAGSRGKNLLQVDAFGVVKAVQAAEQAGIKRFILLSSIFALEPEHWGEAFLAGLTDYNIAKFFADNYLLNSSLDYTILQPGHLLESAGSGNILLNPATPQANSIENVVAVLASLPTMPNTVRKVIKMADGDTDIQTALAGV